MSLDRLHYELKLMGKWVILTPALIMLGFTLFSFLLNYIKTNPARFLLAGPEMMLPLSAGVIVGTIITQDAALELQLTSPKKYHLTGILRLFIIFVWTACIALISISVLNALHLLFMPAFTFSWTPIIQFLTIQMIWFAPLLWCMAVAFCFALIMQSRSAAGALLAGIWIAEIVLKGWIAINPWLRPMLLFPTTLLIFPWTNVQQSDFNTYWLATRIELLITAAILFPLGWLLLRNTEHMLKGATEE
jgi:hypothetical protein